MTTAARRAAAVRNNSFSISPQELSAKTKLTDEKVGHQFTLVLADDDTEVDDEEYFQSLPDNTVFLIVHVGGDNGRGRHRQRNCER